MSEHETGAEIRAAVLFQGIPLGVKPEVSLKE
jgi:hypothetical protein